MQGMLQEVPKMGTQKQPAARLMLETLLNAVSSIQPRDEESAETQQALEVAVQVMLHITLKCLITPMQSQLLFDLKSRLQGLEDNFAEKQGLYQCMSYRPAMPPIHVFQCLTSGADARVTSNCHRTGALGAAAASERRQRGRHSKGAARQAGCVCLPDYEWQSSGQERCCCPP